MLAVYYSYPAVSKEEDTIYSSVSRVSFYGEH